MISECPSSYLCFEKLHQVPVCPAFALSKLISNLGPSVTDGPGIHSLCSSVFPRWLSASTDVPHLGFISGYSSYSQAEEKATRLKGQAHLFHVRYSV